MNKQFKMAINATELRIGNLIETPLGIDIVESITNTNVFTKNNWSSYDIEKCCPIALTEKWLLKFDFEKYEEGKYILYIKSKHNVALKAEIEYPSNKMYVKIEDGDHGSIGEEIEFVHNLQNLYFALYKKEKL